MDKRGNNDNQIGGQKLKVVPTRVGYNRWAEIYDQEENPLVLLEEQYIGRLAGKVAGLKVADIGCGTGRHAVRLTRAGAQVTAVDFSEAMLDRARAKPGAETMKFIRHDLTRRLPLRSHSFDRVFCCLVLDHIPRPESFFRELRRLCRPEGRIIISVMHPAMLLRGVQARFVDPATGSRIGPASYPHQVSDYVMAAIRSGLCLETMSEHAIDSKLAQRSARAAKYLGWPLLLLLRLAPQPQRRVRPR